MANVITIGTITTPNPTLWVDMNTLGTASVQYKIQTGSPGGQWLYVNQFCSLLSTYWLNDVNSPNIYGILNLSDQMKITAAQQLINLLSLAQQEQEAVGSIANSSSVTLSAFTAAVATYPVGTKIWCGNDQHVVGFLITQVADASTTPATPGTYTLYDSNTGTAQTGQLTANLAALATVMQWSAFVVGKPV